jgi:hypothetical protein
MIALARKLLVALWRYVTDGVVPDGAKLKAASLLTERGRWLAVAAENPRARQGADVKIGPAARNPFSRMSGSWLGIAGSPPDTRLAGSAHCLKVGVHRDQHLGLDLAALIRGFRMPADCGTALHVRRPASETVHNSDCHARFSYEFRGETTRNVAPFLPSDDTVSCPPWHSTIVRQIASPSPIPYGLVVTTAAKMSFSCSG